MIKRKTAIYKPNIFEAKVIQHIHMSDIEVRSLIRRHRISFAGNKNLKIYGKLYCTAGKSMKKQNRVFFCSLEEALENKYRPCGHCMKPDYKKWKDGFI